jgi:pumilio RNA-binding family
MTLTSAVTQGKSSSPESKSKRKAKGHKQGAIANMASYNRSLETTGDIDDLGSNAERCKQTLAQLESRETAPVALAKILPWTMRLALSKHGCRVIQKAIEVGSSADHALIVGELAGHITELYRSPHGNHVVTTLIQVMPPANLGFLLKELQVSEGGVVAAARHQYGCRLLERLVEHCPAQQVSSLVEEALVDAEPLCRHPYANFVMQHLFEHGTPEWKASIAAQISGAISHLAKHRTASHLVQRALEFGGEEIQTTLVASLVSGKGEDSLVEVACSRYGSFVVEELASIPAEYEHVRRLLLDGLPQLSQSSYGKRALSKFGILPEPGSLKAAELSSRA